MNSSWMMTEKDGEKRVFIGITKKQAEVIIKHGTHELYSLKMQLIHAFKLNQCPDCSWEFEPSANFCSHCGINLQEKFAWWGLGHYV